MSVFAAGIAMAKVNVNLDTIRSGLMIIAEKGKELAAAAENVTTDTIRTGLQQAAEKRQQLAQDAPAVFNQASHFRCHNLSTWFLTTWCIHGRIKHLT